MDNSIKLQKTNQLVLSMIWTLDLFLIVGYLVEYLKGGRSLGFVAVFIAIVIIPMLGVSYVYFKDRDSNTLKYITLAGYLLVYIYALFSSTRTLTYVYLFSVIVIYFLYFDLKLMVVSCSILTLLNLVRIIYFIGVLKINDTNSTTDYTIQFCSVLLFSIAIVLATKISNELHEEKLKSIEDEKKKQTVILSDVLNTASMLDNHTAKVYEIIEELGSSVTVVNNAMIEIAHGSNETTESIENQSQLTRKIHSTIEDASKTSKNVEEISKDTTAAMRQGMLIVEELTSKNTVLNQKSENLYGAMLDFKNKSSDIENILGFITEIAERTNLLSLNAAIESARAGEAGKGFGVVSVEIRKLAAQSNDSANNIGVIIKELVRNIEHSVEAAEQLKVVNKEQNELIEKTKEIFNDSILKMKDVNENINVVSEKIKGILLANNNIINSINQISALSDETMASTQEAAAMTERNALGATNAKQLVRELMDTSEQMKKYL